MSNLTKRALEESAVKLLEERPLDKIKIKDITDDCGVTRNTFYYHFRDVYELLERIFESQADEILKKYDNTGDWKDVFLNLLEYLYEHRKMVYHVYYSVRHEDLEIYIYKVVGNYALRIIEMQEDGIYIEDRVKTIVADFYRNAFVGATIQWIRDNMRDKPSDLAKLYGSMFKGTVREAVESARKVTEK